MESIINEYLSKIIQNLVHYRSCQGVRRAAYLNFFSGRRGPMLKGLSLGTCGLDLGLEGWPWP